jgi:hypothetical protein
MFRSAEERAMGGGPVPDNGMGAPVSPAREFARDLPRLRASAEF